MPQLRPHVPLKTDNRSLVVVALRDWFQADGTDLARWVRTWQLQDGASADQIEPEMFTASLFPLFRMRLEGAPGVWRNEVTTKGPLELAITLGLCGNRVEDVLNAWGTFERRIFPGDASLYRIIKPMGVVAYSITQPAVTVKHYTDGNAQLVNGRIRLEYEFRTQY